jgi:hypothetical protein
MQYYMSMKPRFFLSFVHSYVGSFVHSFVRTALQIVRSLFFHIDRLFRTSYSNYVFIIIDVSLNGLFKFIILFFSYIRRVHSFRTDCRTCTIVCTMRLASLMSLLCVLYYFNVCSGVCTFTHSILLCTERGGVQQREREE